MLWDLFKSLFKSKPKPKPKPNIPPPRMLPNPPFIAEIKEPTLEHVYHEKRMMLVREARKWLWVRESGYNRGAEVERFQREVDGKATGEPWCAGFAAFCVNQVDRDYRKTYGNDPLPNWLCPTEHCLTLWNKTDIRSRIAADEIYPGSLIIWQFWKNGKPTSNGHIGIIIQWIAANDFMTIEGNTKDRDTVVREGDGVHMMRRMVSKSGNFRLKGIISPWELVKSTAQPE